MYSIFKLVLGEMLGEDLSFREKVVADSTMLSLIDLNVKTPPLRTA